MDSAVSFRIPGPFSESPRLRLLPTAELALSSRGGQQSVGEAVGVLSVHAQPQQWRRRSVTVVPGGPGYTRPHCRCFSGSAETSKANGSSPSQDHFVSLSQATVPASHTQKGKGTFTDDLLQLVDNFARDAISLSQCKRGPKNGATAVLGHEVSAACRFLVSNRGGYEAFVCTNG